MWWCCGKQGKEQPGCKFQKHESKDDEVDDEAENLEQNQFKNSKYQRCTCCKQRGHSFKDCTRDPNIKTGARIEDEFERIVKMKDFRKLFADSIIQTTHMLKKSVMIPIKHDDDGNLEDMPNAYNPFKRGVMEFDDYNYRVHNPYVLVEDPKVVEYEKSKQQAPTMGLGSDRSGLPGGTTSMPMTVGGPPGSDPTKDPALSKKNVDNSITDEYQQDLVTILPSEMELEKAEAARQALIAE